MTALPEHWEERSLTPEEYLAFEEASETKHEYVNGYAYAMAGASLEHNYIATNLIADLGAQLRGMPCAVFGSDKRLKITSSHKTYWYYPDVTVDCCAQKGYDTLSPTVLIEVISPTTRRADGGDKIIRYLNLPSLLVYALVEQDVALITIHRREAEGPWQEETVSGLDATLSLPEIGCSLPLKFIYDRVEFPA